MSNQLESEKILSKYIDKDVSVNIPNTKADMFKVWLPSGLLNSKAYYKYANHPTGLYHLFRNNEIRGVMRTPLYIQLRKEYFEYGHVVCALSYSQIEEKTGWFRSKISRYVDKLVKWRWIRIDKIDVGKKEEQNVYLLGRLNGLGNTVYYMDEIVNSSQK